MSQDFMFGEDYMSNNFEYDDLNLAMCDQLDVPNEAFVPRSDLTMESSTPPEEYGPHNNPNNKEDLQSSEGDGLKLINYLSFSFVLNLLLSLCEDLGLNSDFVMSGSLQTVETFRPPPPLDFSSCLKEMLFYYADKGEIQMTVSIYIVVGEKLNKKKVAQRTYFFFFYINL